MPLTSLVIPSAGLYRHNERLWALLGASKAAFPFEVVIPCFGEPSARLAARLSQLAIPHRFVVVGDHLGHIGALLHAATHVAIGDVVVWMHDDAMPKGELRAFLRELGRFEPGEGVRVPTVVDSMNHDQAGGANASPFSTRYVDRAVIAFPRALYLSLGLDVSDYAIDGYQVAVQAAAAREGLKTVVCRAAATHEGGATLINLPARDYAALFEADTKAVSGVLGTYVEHGQRPAVPRIIPKGIARDIDFFFEDSGFDPGDAVNSFDQQTFRYRGEPFGRITCGDRYTIPPLLDVYDVALVASMGIGDTMMHSAACYHFKKLFPHVRFRVFGPKHVAYVASRLPGAFDQVIELAQGETFPPSARVWNVANGVEGTPMFGFEQLGIADIPCEERRMAPYVRKSIEFMPLPAGRKIGIQLNGGWKHKRYEHPDALADALADMGYTPIHFGTLDVPLSGRHARIVTPTLDDFAGCLLQLDGWIGFDSGASFIANSLGIPTVWLYASHNPGGLIEACGAAGPYRTIWPAKPSECAKRFGKTCRPGLGGAFFGWGTCGRKEPGGVGAACLDELDPSFLAREVVNLVTEFTSL